MGSEIVRMSEVHLYMEIEVVGAMGKVWKIGALNNRTQQVMIFTDDDIDQHGDVKYEQVANVTPAWAKVKP